MLFFFLPPTTLFLFDVWLPLLILVDSFHGANTQLALVVALYVSCHLLSYFAATLARISGAPLLVGQLLLLSPALALESFLLAFEPSLPFALASVRLYRQPPIVSAGIQRVAPGLQLVVVEWFP